MSTKISELPFDKGLVLINDVWKTKTKIKKGDNFYVINTPKDLCKASIGDVYSVEKINYPVNGKMGKRLIAKKIPTTPRELLPLKKPQKTTLLKRGNGLLKIEINKIDYIVLENDIIGIDRMHIGDSIELISAKSEQGTTTICEYFKNITEQELFTWLSSIFFSSGLVPTKLKNALKKWGVAVCCIISKIF